MPVTYTWSPDQWRCIDQSGDISTENIGKGKKKKEKKGKSRESDNSGIC